MFLALAFATAAALGVYAYASSVNREEAAPAQAAPSSVPSLGVDVVVAKGDIAANTALTAELLETRQVPPELKNGRALTVADDAVGRVTTVPLMAGEQVLTSRLVGEALPPQTFARGVPPGKRALSVVFDEVIGSGALVQPGDRVDVIAFFEFEVDDPTIQGATRGGDRDSGGAGIDESDTDALEELFEEIADEDYDYKQYVSSYIVQDVEVLAVAQALTPDEAGVEQPGAPAPSPTPTPDPEATATADAPTPASGDPVARPGAKSVTLAVSPEQAQRLLLASQTVKKEQGSLRLALRAPGDTTTVDLRPAQLGDIPIGSLLGDVNKAMVPSEVVITDVEFTERALAVGGVLEFKATVKNITDHPIASGRTVAPEYAYQQGDAYDALGFVEPEGSYRIGLNVAGAFPTQFPYRWGLGRDLEPGESVTVFGSVRLTEPTAGTRYWLAVIQEPNTVTQDGVGAADVTVTLPEEVSIRQASAQVRAEPDAGAAIVQKFEEGTRLTVLDARDGWFRVRVGGTEGWVEASAVSAEAAKPVGIPWGWRSNQ